MGQYILTLYSVSCTFEALNFLGERVSFETDPRYSRYSYFTNLFSCIRGYYTLI